MSLLMEIAWGLIYAFFLLVVFSCLLLLRRRGKKEVHGVLRMPPGSMGWPFIGETFQLFSQDPNIFFASRQKRYGEIFKTHVLGYPCVMLASPEAARFVLVSQAHLFKPTYPQSKERLIGPWALFFHQGAYHARLRKLVNSSLAPRAIRLLLPKIESSAAAVLRSWDGRELGSFQALKRFSFDVGILAIFGGHFVEQRRNAFLENYLVVDKGYNSFPTNFKWTPYGKAMRARSRLGDLLREVVKERREKDDAGTDLLSCLMEWRDEEGGRLSDEQIADNVIGLLFAAQDTTASVLTWLIKYLNDHPKLLKAAKAEQMAIYEMNGCGRRPLEWTQIKSMPLTYKIILESLRMASVISFAFREAVADVEYKGCLIPKGWKVMPLFRNIHHNPDFFSDPQKFDPSRFNTSPMPNTFLPFGNGEHACPGNELAKLQMLVFVHQLVTQYRFEVVGSQTEVEYGPFPVPKHGLPVRLSRSGERP
ncbi:hypothetical protein HPP92_010966 [Vanilla planifolia]|uniref:(+)-abscisic acid 8'-hydroxylase n=1 Tax=Vanilla planifolia TaxID=51239 RepID=A0A835R543_VANPL|nr:hypothetical protein HPP92_010966 [Vanilla planifolia]